MRVAIIGGTGVYDPGILDNIKELDIKTPYGDALVISGTYNGEEVGFMARHGRGHSVPPHLVNYRANIWALKSLGVKRIIATAAVGSLREELVPGDMVMLDQFLDFTKVRPVTFFEGGEVGVIHQNVTEPYCPQLRQILYDKGRELGLSMHNGGCYVTAEGPRFETAAEIKAYRILGGDVVGMTSVPEVVLAREAGMCYSTVGMVTNYAAGVSTNVVSHEEVLEIMAEHGKNLRELVMSAIPNIPAEHHCSCVELGYDLPGLSK